MNEMAPLNAPSLNEQEVEDVKIRPAETILEQVCDEPEEPVGPTKPAGVQPWRWRKNHRGRNKLFMLRWKLSLRWLLLFISNLVNLKEKLLVLVSF